MYFVTEQKDGTRERRHYQPFMSVVGAGYDTVEMDLEDFNRLADAAEAEGAERLASYFRMLMTRQYHPNRFRKD